VLSSAIDLAALIRTREISPVEIVRAHIDKACSVNPRINAIAVARFEEALDEARAAEKALYDGTPLGPLHGVPCTVKEGLGFEGLPHTSGSILRQGNVAARHGTVVERIRAAGAIVIGLGNMSEMAMWPESDNRVYGRTSNPHDVSRTSGGSSGGDAAAVGAGAAVFGIATDGGGSIRIPAAYCGVFGHKPSSRTVPLSGHVPLDHVFRSHRGSVAMARYFAAGPIARSAADLMPLLRVIAGPDGIDTNVSETCLANPATVDFRGKQVFLCPDPVIKWLGRADAGIAEGVVRAARHFETSGARVEYWSHPLLWDAFDIWLSTVAATQGPSMNEILGNGNGLPLIDVAREALSGCRRHTRGPLLAAAAERLFKPSPRRIQRHLLAGAAVRADIERKLGPDGLLLMPVAPRPPPLHGQPLLRPFDIAYCALFNALELPASVAPVGIMPNGLPGSVQLVGARGADHVTIAGAMMIEQAFGGWRRPRMPDAATPAAR